MDFTNIIHGSIDSLKDDIKIVNSEIHANPELAYNEHAAHNVLVSFLQTHGFAVIPHAYGIETSFQAEYGIGGRVICFCAEYDALPNMGHACGHNLIASSSLAAFCGVAAALQVKGSPGRVRLLGTPAEEAGAGKVRLMNAGAYKDVEVAMMCHPTKAMGGNGSGSLPHKSGIANPTCFASMRIQATFTGKPTHAGSTPWLGINAVDAATLAYMAIGLLRQQVKPSSRLNVVIKGTEELVSGIIPEKANVLCGVRCESLEEVSALRTRVQKCFEGAAIASGSTVECAESGDLYADLRPNDSLCTSYTSAMSRLGFEYDCDLSCPPRGGWGTDMGNISHYVPSFHGSFYIPSLDGEFPHSRGFARAAVTSEAFDVAIGVGKGMAETAWQFLTDEEFARDVQASFRLIHDERYSN